MATTDLKLEIKDMRISILVKRMRKRLDARRDARARGLYDRNDKAAQEAWRKASKAVISTRGELSELRKERKAHYPGIFDPNDPAVLRGIYLADRARRWSAAIVAHERRRTDPLFGPRPDPPDLNTILEP